MKAIVATPKKIKDIFQSTYNIPNFQRPYSWEETQCLTLLNDITDYYETHGNTPGEEYYLGNIVLYHENNSDTWSVVDGQQRLTTMLLLLKAMFSKANTATALEDCLKQKDPLTSERINKLKIESDVIAEDRKELTDVILSDNFEGKSRIKKNYRAISDALEEWLQGRSSEDINHFILTLLNNVGMLPIECSSLDDALIIFNTVNNRGMPLNDADIFKAYMLTGIASDKEPSKKFIDRWNVLNEDEDIERYFRILMHLRRAQDGIVEREIALRTFYEANQHKNLNPYNDVLKALEKIKYFDDEWPISDRMKNLWTILWLERPNDYAYYPIYTFWYKYAKEKTIDTGETTWILPENKMKALETLLEETIKYYFVNAVAYNSVNKVKDTTYKVCKAIMRDDSYEKFYTENYNNAYKIFHTKITQHEYGKCRMGLVILLAVLNKKQDQKKLYDIEEWDLEHILPQKGGYNNYNGWTEQEYTDNLNTLGNFVLFERPLNIRASNDFFAKKQIQYKTSEIQEARDLLNFPDWTYNEWKKREDIKEKEIFKFFSK